MQKYDVAAYIWPSYTGDEPRSRMFWPEGMGEWQSVKNSKPKANGYHWNRKPLWGYVNEADPYVMEQQIQCAHDYGVNVFIYDWYWYDRRPFLEQCLDNGYLKARNNNLVKFYIMWANHNANHLWNKELSDTYGNTVIWEGTQPRSEFERIAHRIIDNYFGHPSYYKIDGKPVFMIYELSTLVQGLGGVEETRRALEWFREETVKAGYPGLHLQLTARSNSFQNVSGVDSTAKPVHDDVGFDSLTHYQYAHYINMNRDYLEILEDAKKELDRIEKSGTLYFPHASIGWDNNPRFYNFIDRVCRNNTPENFEKALRMCKDYLDRHPEQHKLVTINSWNEWTETSYLEPDDLYGYGYLEAVKRVFGE
ncbi:MAG: glycoside hydrolase family 99-like domain-containing protein [Clostridia bacterium]|nr:glycoside hydrolase family 99-like domain-containing protein [Clostridia bacterium]